MSDLFANAYSLQKSQSEKIDYQKIISSISLMFRKSGVDYEGSKYIIEEVRKKNKLKQKPTRKDRLPCIPSVDEVKAILDLALKSNYTHYLVIVLFCTTGARVSELMSIKCCDVYLSERKIFINKGKREKDRYVPFPLGLLSDLTAIIQKRRGDDYLIHSRLHKGYENRGSIWHFIVKYAKLLKIEKKITPHILRHYFITALSSSLSDSEVQIISGHSNKQNLGIYQHMAINGILKEKYDSVISDVIKV